MSSNGSYIVAGGYNNQIYLFHNSSSTPLWTYPAINDILDIAISSDGNYIIASTSPYYPTGSRAYFFHKSSPNPLWTFTSITDHMRHVAISANGSYIAVVTDRVYLFEKSSSTPLWIYAAGGLESLAISDDGNYIVAGGGYPSAHVYFFHRSSSTPLWIHDSPQVWSLAISSDGNYIVAGDHGGEVNFFQRSSSTPIWEYTASDAVWSVSISNDGKYIGAGSADGNVYFFENSNSTPIWNYQVGALVRSAELTDFGDYLIVGSEDNSIYFFNTLKNEPIWKFDTANKVLSADISSKGTCSVAGSFDYNVYYFNKLHDNKPPIITNITVSKDLIEEGDIQFISCKVTDNTGIQNVIANLENPDENISLDIDLYDDGTYGDLIPNDAIFTRSWNSLGFPMNNYFVDFKAIDNSSVGNIQSIDNGAMFTILDTRVPRINIDSPSPNFLSGIVAPTFSLTIYEPNILAKYYSINGRANITFTIENQINQSEWNSIGNGTVNITFYVIDKVGHMNSSEITIRKDSYVPDITIFAPIQDEIFGLTPPEFNISIVEEDLNKTWYTLQRSTIQNSFTGFTGIINQYAWNNLPEGNITITFFAQDRAGNIGTINVSILKHIPYIPTPYTPTIFEYITFLIIGIIGVMSIIIKHLYRKN